MTSSNGDRGGGSLIDDDIVRRLEAVHDWYHSVFTGTVLYVLSRRGSDAGFRIVYEVFRRQRETKFIAGLQRLEISDLPPAVAAAQYHYLSNNIGGVAVEYMPESDTKAWIRYRAPRWIWAGTAICGIPTDVTRAMLLGWHAQNGVSLGNPRLGFVCTKQVTDGDSSLEGYYIEYDHDIAPDERLRYARHESGPTFDSKLAPSLPAVDWPIERLLKAKRGYSREYVRTLLPAVVDCFGPDEGGAMAGSSIRLVGMQEYHRLFRAVLGRDADESIASFAEFLVAFWQASGEAVDVHWCTSSRALRVVQTGSRVFVPSKVHKSVIDAWGEMISGFAAAHNHTFDVSFEKEAAGSAGEDMQLVWSIRGPFEGVKFLQTESVSSDGG